MTNDRRDETLDDRRRACPVSGALSHRVEIRTVKALLTTGALSRLRDAPHFFCADPACDTVYFDGSSGCYLRSDLRVPVYQKEPPGGRLLCYCFGDSETSIREEVQAGGRSEAAVRIRRHIAAGRCACDLRNPKGACCLGELIGVVNAANRRGRGTGGA